MESWKLLKDLRKQGEYQQALEKGAELLTQNADDFMVKSQLEWVHYDLIKEMAQEWEQQEDSGAGPASPELRNRLIDQLRDYARLRPKLPSMAYGNIVAKIAKVAKQIDSFPKMVEWFSLQDAEGTLGIPADQWKPNVWQGKTSQSNAIKLARALAAWVKSNPEKRNQELIDFALDIAERVYRDSADTDKLWLEWDLAALHRLAGNSDQAESRVRTVLKAKRSEFWPWAEAGRLYRPERPDLAISCFCQAVRLGNEPKFLGKIHVELAELLAESGEQGQASKEIVVAAEIYDQQGWAHPKELEAALAADWYDPSLPHELPETYYSLLAERALELCYDSTETVPANFLGFTEGRNGKKPLPRFAIAGDPGAVSLIGKRALPTENLRSGQPLEITVARDGSRRDILELNDRADGSPWDVVQETHRSRLPLELINKASAREKSIRHGHPSTLHLWWARRPLAAARAVIFAQMVDDPSAHPDLFPTEQKQEKERQRLFRIIEDLVQWENTTNEEVLERARAEIWQSLAARPARNNVAHPRAKELFDRAKLPAFHDPFAGGGALPLEAQRLGLESHASDLNPVAVLINKAMIEIPPKFAVGPEIEADKTSRKKSTRDSFEDWSGACGMAEDVRRYGNWMRQEAYQRIGHLYPPIEVTEEMINNSENPRPDLRRYLGRKLTVIAWIWARTVYSPNPAHADTMVPLASNFVLCAKRGKEAWIEPIVSSESYKFRVRIGGRIDESLKNGTKLGRGASFKCLMSDTPINASYIVDQACAGRLGKRLMAVVAEGDSEKVFLDATSLQDSTSGSYERPTQLPELPMPENPRWFSPPKYGLKNFSDVFTNRQANMLGTLANLVDESRSRVVEDQNVTVPSGVGRELQARDKKEYSSAIQTYLAFALSRMADRHSTLCRWDPNPSGYAPKIANTFGRQAIPMVWDYVEGNPFSPSSGNLTDAIGWIVKVIEKVSTK
jgi:hypothetical protein